MTPLDRTELRRWKTTLNYHKMKYGKSAFAYAFQEFWRWYLMNRPGGLSKDELRQALEEK